MKNYILRMEYIGRNFYGFQKQRDLPTIQGSTEGALTRILRVPISVNGASRTDRGVNAFNQYVNFYFDGEIDPVKLKKKLNSLLAQKGIIIKEVQEVDMKFHSRKSAKGKVYTYILSSCRERDFFLSPYVYFHHSELNKDLLNLAMKGLKGKHDFSIFANRDRSIPRRNNICELFAVGFIEKNGLLVFYFLGDRFLYHMVRRMVYYLIKAGEGAIKKDYLEAPFNVSGIPYTRQVLSPEPLFLVNVVYNSLTKF